MENRPLSLEEKKTTQALYASFFYWYTRYCLLLRELLFTGTRVIVYWHASYCLLVRELVFTGSELLFTGTRVTVYWYASYCLLVRGLNKKNRNQGKEALSCNHCFSEKQKVLHILSVYL